MTELLVAGLLLQTLTKILIISISIITKLPDKLRGLDGYSDSGISNYVSNFPLMSAGCNPTERPV